MSQSENKKVYWVGLETAGNPHGFGEDYREYVTVENGNDPALQLREAVARWNSILSLDHGCRIAIRKVYPKWISG